MRTKTCENTTTTSVQPQLIPGRKILQYVSDCKRNDVLDNGVKDEVSDVADPLDLDAICSTLLVCVTPVGSFHD